MISFDRRGVTKMLKNTRKNENDEGKEESVDACL